MNLPYKIFSILLLASFFQLSYSQKVYLNDYSSFCESDVFTEGKYLQERINSIEKQYDYWIIKATIIEDCGLKLYPEIIQQNDTLLIDTKTIDFQYNILENQDTVVEMSQPEECYCAYLISLKLLTDTISNIKLNGKSLPFTDERFQTFPIKYFVYNGDTTGYQDKYGLRQGIIVMKRKDNRVLKQYYQDNLINKYQLFDSKGKLLMETKEIDDILNYKK